MPPVQTIILIVILVWLAWATMYGPSVSAALHWIRRVATPTEIIERDRMIRESQAKLKGAWGQW